MLLKISLISLTYILLRTFFIDIDVGSALEYTTDSYVVSLLDSMNTHIIAIYVFGVINIITLFFTRRTYKQKM